MTNQVIPTNKRQAVHIEEGYEAMVERQKIKKARVGDGQPNDRWGKEEWFGPGQKEKSCACSQRWTHGRAGLKEKLNLGSVRKTTWKDSAGSMSCLRYGARGMASRRGDGKRHQLLLPRLRRRKRLHLSARESDHFETKTEKEL